MESSDRTLEVRFDIETKQTTGFVSLVHTEMGLHTSRVSIVAGLTSVSSTVAAVAAGQRGRLVPVFHIHRLLHSFFFFANVVQGKRERARKVMFDI